MPTSYETLSQLFNAANNNCDTFANSYEMLQQFLNILKPKEIATLLEVSMLLLPTTYEMLQNLFKVLNLIVEANFLWNAAKNAVTLLGVGTLS